MKLSQALGASYDLTLSGNTYTISPLRVEHRLAVEKWLMEQRMAAFAGDAQYSLLAMLPDAVRATMFADLMKSPPSFVDYRKTERTRLYVLYVACNASVNNKTMPFDEFTKTLNDQDVNTLEMICYWLGKLDWELEDDHPLVLRSKSCSGEKAA